MKTIYPKGCIENPYMLEEYKTFSNGTWPGGYIETLGYIPGTEDDKSASGSGGSTGSLEPAPATVLPGSASKSVPCLTSFGLKISFSWTSGTVTQTCTSKITIDNTEMEEIPNGDSDEYERPTQYSLESLDAEWIGLYNIRFIGEGKANILKFKNGTCKTITQKFHINNSFTVPEGYHGAGSK